MLGRAALPPPPSMSRAIVLKMTLEGTITVDLLAALTKREREIVRLVGEGLPDKEIGRRLNLSSDTVKIHLHNIYLKLKGHNRTVLAMLALNEGKLSESNNQADNVSLNVKKCPNCGHEW